MCFTRDPDVREGASAKSMAETYLAVQTPLEDNANFVGPRSWFRGIHIETRGDGTEHLRHSKKKQS